MCPFVCVSAAAEKARVTCLVKQSHSTHLPRLQTTHSKDPEESTHPKDRVHNEVFKFIKPQTLPQPVNC